MKFLMEHEAGFDTQSIGFPSIMGCHAICAATPDGLFGYHNAGGSALAAFNTRADAFEKYIKAKLGGRLPTVWHLYGSSFIGNNQRGYTQGRARQEWRAELETFASIFNYGGPISGCDLAPWLPGHDVSAYVEYQAVGMGCTISVKRWSDVGKVTAVNPKDLDMTKMIGSVQNGSMVTNVDRSGLMQVIPEVVRG